MDPWRSVSDQIASISCPVKQVCVHEAEPLSRVSFSSHRMYVGECVNNNNNNNNRISIPPSVVTSEAVADISTTLSDL